MFFFVNNFACRGEAYFDKLSNRASPLPYITQKSRFSYKFVDNLHLLLITFFKNGFISPQIRVAIIRIFFVSLQDE